MGNVLGLAIGSQAKAPFSIKTGGLFEGGQALAVYCSTETHGWVQKGAALLGLGTNSLRKIPVDSDYRMNIAALKQAIKDDVANGYVPVCVVASAGTVNTGAIDDLNAIADICRDNNIWFHIDGAFGALAKLSPSTALLVSGVERADSVVFDLHKWMYLPFEIACLLVRDPEAHKGAFYFAPSYIAPLDRGVIAGGLQLANRGMALTRNFKALKAWMCIKAYGITKFGELIEQNVAQTKRLVSLVEAHPNLELLAPAPLNITCLRYVADGLNDEELNSLNTELLLRLQERGIAVPSSTMLNGKFALRVCIVNHRTRMSDMDDLAEAVAKMGDEIKAERKVYA